LADQRRVNKRYCTDTIRVDYAHVGLFDVEQRTMWIARRRWNTAPVRVSHARLLVGGTQDTSTADKDRFLCYWFHTPNTGEGYVHGYPIEWEEGHLLVRLDPNWDFRRQQFIPHTDTAWMERSIEQQYAWGQRIFNAYIAKGPKFPLAWHMVGPRAVESMFYIDRIEPE
jgi:hypothetical protein